MLRARRRAGPVGPREGWPRLDEGERIYAVGDIHGRLDLLTTMKQRIEADLSAAPSARATVVFLGDYVDRGAQSRGVIEFLIGEPIGDCDRVCLKGNHEAMLLDFLAEPAAGDLWFMNGGLETLASYGVRLLPEAAAIGGLEAPHARFAAALPGDHREFLMELPLTHEAGDYLFVHAGVRPGIPIDQQMERDLLWIREPFYASTEPTERYVVHGHTPVEEPMILRHRADIDTGAWMTGMLTCLVLEGGDRRLISVEG